MNKYEHPYDRFLRVNKPDEPWWQSILWTVVVFVVVGAGIYITLAIGNQWDANQSSISAELERHQQIHTLRTR